MCAHRPRQRVYLFGGHTEHSLAPALWNLVFERLGESCEYVPKNTDAETLPADVLLLRDPGTIGANVTIPLKEAGAALADRRHEEVHLTGATNWLTWRDGSLYAANTDVTAARRLAAGAWGQVLLLGAGGGAAAVAAGMREGVERFVVADIDERRGCRLRDRIAAWGTEAVAVRWGSRQREVPRSDVVVNATPLGMAGPLARQSPLEPAWLSGGTRVYDLVYAPTETPLQRQAGELGLPLVDGLAHLYEQAVALLPLMNLRDDVAGLLDEALSAAFGGRRRKDWTASLPHRDK